MGNLEHGNMLMGPNMRPAITSSPGGHSSKQMMIQQKPPSSGSAMQIGGQGMMIQGGKLKNVGQ